jgi:uncharacterized membrane protein
MGDPDDQRDEDAEARSEALRFIVRRTTIWAVPLTLIGALLTALGIPLWICVAALLIVLVVLVFEIDL